jgi:hypothetical protein
MSAIAPSADDSYGMHVFTVGMVVDNCEVACVDAPIGVSIVDLADWVQLAHGAFDAYSRKPPRVKAFFCVDRPREAIDRHLVRNYAALGMAPLTASSQHPWQDGPR